MNVETINDVFFAVVDRNQKCVLRYKQRTSWVPVSAAEFYRSVVGTAKSLEAWGIGFGDRVAILSENRYEWAVADFATMLIGAVDVPIYPTLTAEQTAFVLQNSGARAVFVSTQEQLRKVTSIQKQTAVEKVIVMDYIGTPDAIPMHRLMHAGPKGRDAEFDARARAIPADATATIIYTSGTTGTPKGAMLTQRNLASNLLHSLDFYKFGPGHRSLSFLPLSHITARHLDYAMYWHGVIVAYCPFLDDLLPSLSQVKPTVFVAVPRVYEKIHNQTIARASRGLKKKIFDWAMRVGREHREEIYAGERPNDVDWFVANRLVFSKISKVLGGRVEVFISGGAPLSRELQDWYATVGLRIFEGYGLTETSPVIALNNPRAFRAGSVGRPLSNLELRIADDGEILVKGPSIFEGYWHMPVETENAFEGDWFRTGDVGRLDDAGFLFITDRKKDLIKTSGGKFIAPQPIEGTLKSNTLIAEAALVGDRRKFPMVIISPNFVALEDWAKDRMLAYSSREELVEYPAVQALYKDAVAHVNRDLAQFEKIKKVLLVPDEFTVANGALTPTMKLKRRVIEERYRTQIEEVYSTGAEIVGAS